MLRVIFRLGHSCHINYDDQCRGLLDVQQCHHSGPQHGCCKLKHHPNSMNMVSHDTCHFQHELRGICHKKLGIWRLICSCSWGFPENKGVAQQHQKESHISCLKDLYVRLQKCVHKMCVQGGLQRDDWLRVFTQYTYQMPALAGIWYAPFISVSTIVVLGVPPVSSTSDGNMDAPSWLSCFDVHLPRHLGLVPKSGVQARMSR